MTIEWERTEVTWKLAWKQIIPIIPKKREFVHGILDGTGCAPCETFDEKKKEEALKFLINPYLLRDKEFSDVESWQEYFHSLSSDPTFKDLKKYYNLWYIDDEEIWTAIEQFLTEKSWEILEYLIYLKWYKPIVSHDLSTTRRKILAWGLYNGLFTPDLIEKIDFGESESKESLLEKYSNGIEFNLFIAITEALKPQEAREAQGQISLEDSVILFDN